ncbi:CoA transferase [Maritalea sp.]|uniref:CoA transferase n=1 Tax=Maritalea sp. TaxID=2003361 RepID=UPI003EFABA4A
MTNPFLSEIVANLRLGVEVNEMNCVIENAQKLPSWFDVSSLASASLVGVSEALRVLMFAHDNAWTPTISVDQRLASHWFAQSLYLVDRDPPAVWDNIAGDYRSNSGWIRLHTNAPHHKEAALNVLGVEANRMKVAAAVRKWDGLALETAIVNAGGCAAQMRSIDDWAVHPQGEALKSEPLIAWQKPQGAHQSNFVLQNFKRPLKGLKVLDLTRVIAGPVATRTLAGLGATVLRLDPVWWDEPGLYEEMTIGKTCAHLDLTQRTNRLHFTDLLKNADVLVHGLRADALKRLGFSSAQRQKINPALIDVAHNAYGWTGPWANRRGFDSLVQMSSGIADFGMKKGQHVKPTPLPVQALDHATGYLVAAAVLSALAQSKLNGHASAARLSLARVAQMLTQTGGDHASGDVAELCNNDFIAEREQTHLGGAKRLKFPLKIDGVDFAWDVPAGSLRIAKANWPET